MQAKVIFHHGVQFGICHAHVQEGIKRKKANNIDDGTTVQQHLKERRHLGVTFRRYASCRNHGSLRFVCVCREDCDSFIVVDK